MLAAILISTLLGILFGLILPRLAEWRYAMLARYRRDEPDPPPEHNLYEAAEDPEKFLAQQLLAEIAHAAYWRAGGPTREWEELSPAERERWGDVVRAVQHELSLEDVPF